MACTPPTAKMEVSPISEDKELEALYKKLGKIRKVNQERAQRNYQEHREERLAYGKKWREANREYYLAYQKWKRDSDREAYRKCHREYDRKHRPHRARRRKSVDG